MLSLMAQSGHSNITSVQSHSDIQLYMEFFQPSISTMRVACLDLRDEWLVALATASIRKQFTAACDAEGYWRPLNEFTR